MPAKLESSGLIAQEGASETLAVGSRFTIVDPVPRGPATRWDKLGSFYGGPPRCPKCLSSGHVAFTGFRGSKVPGSFHCRRCLVAWLDTDDVLCFICDAVFRAEPWPPEFRTHRESKYAGHCYHINGIRHPFCPKCEAIIGEDRAHCRRQLRRMVGLR